MSNKKKVQVGGGYDEPTARVLFDGEGFENSGVGGLLFENGGSATGGVWSEGGALSLPASNDRVSRPTAIQNFKTAKKVGGYTF